MIDFIFKTKSNQNHEDKVRCFCGNIQVEPCYYDSITEEPSSVARNALQSTSAFPLRVLFIAVAEFLSMQSRGIAGGYPANDVELNKIRSYE